MGISTGGLVEGISTGGTVEGISTGGTVEGISTGGTATGSAGEATIEDIQDQSSPSSFNDVSIESFASVGSEYEQLNSETIEMLSRVGSTLSLAGEVESLDYLTGRVSLLGAEVFVPLETVGILNVGDYVGVIGVTHSSDSIEVNLIGVYRSRYLAGTSTVVRAYPADQVPATYASAPHFGKSPEATTTLVYGVVRGESERIRNAYLVSK